MPTKCSRVHVVLFCNLIGSARSRRRKSTAFHANVTRLSPPPVFRGESLGPRLYTRGLQRLPKALVLPLSLNRLRRKVLWPVRAIPILTFLTLKVAHFESCSLRKLIISDAHVHDVTEYRCIFMVEKLSRCRATRECYHHRRLLNCVEYPENS